MTRMRLRQIINDDNQIWEEASTLVHHLFLKHSVLSRHGWGSASGALLCDELFDFLDDYTHPDSENAMLMRCIVEGVAYAVVERVTAKLGLSEDVEEELISSLFHNRPSEMRRKLAEIS